MSNKELIELLSKYPLDYQIKFDGNFFIQGYRDNIKVQQTYIDQLENEEPKNFLVLEILE